jgi:hypothetical protein
LPIGAPVMHESVEMFWWPEMVTFILWLLALLFPLNQTSPAPPNGGAVCF